MTRIKDTVGIYAGQALRLNRAGLKSDKTSKDHRTVLQALL